MALLPGCLSYREVQFSPRWGEGGGGGAHHCCPSWAGGAGSQFHVHRVCVCVCLFVFLVTMGVSVVVLLKEWVCVGVFGTQLQTVQKSFADIVFCGGVCSDISKY